MKCSQDYPTCMSQAYRAGFWGDAAEPQPPHCRRRRPCRTPTEVVTFVRLWMLDWNGVFSVLVPITIVRSFFCVMFCLRMVRSSSPIATLPWLSSFIASRRPRRVDSAATSTHELLDAHSEVTRARVWGYDHLSERNRDCEARLHPP
jgi:hypothetical protein